jgi:hypothetical protein
VVYYFGNRNATAHTHWVTPDYHDAYSLPERAFPQFVQLSGIAGRMLLDRIARYAALCFAFVAKLRILWNGPSTTGSAA